MADERRYGEDEVAEIFEAASAPVLSNRGEAPAPAEGLTLAELQEIGRQVGIPPDRIAEAATSLALRPTPAPRRTDLGMPISAGRTLELPRALTDREWALLVSDLRETFRARGNDNSRGEVRAWTNGNLHAYVEPSRTGYRLRMGTVKGDALGLNRLAGLGVVSGAIVALIPLLGGAGAADLGAGLALGGMGAGTMLFNALRLPRWAREREEQMDHIVERVRELVGPGLVSSGSGSPID